MVKIFPLLGTLPPTFIEINIPMDDNNSTPNYPGREIRLAYSFVTIILHLWIIPP